MKTHHVLIFCFVSELFGGNSGIVTAKVYIFTGPEGGTGTINNYFNSPGNKFFCKNTCEADDLLIRTDGNTAQCGRYSIKYEGETSGKGVVAVTFTNLTKSDAGRYRCGMGNSSVPDSYWDLEIRVSSEFLDKNSGFIKTEIEGEEFATECIKTGYEDRKFFCRNRCQGEGEILIDTNNDKDQSGRYTLKYDEGAAHGLRVTISQLTKSDTGWYRCGYGDPLSGNSFMNFQVIVTDDLSTSAPPPTTQSFISSSRGSSASPQTPGQTITFIKTNLPQTEKRSCFLSLVLLGTVVGVLLLAFFLLLLYIWRTIGIPGVNRGNADDTNVELSGKCEDSVYENLKQP